ncbi:MAG: class I SAM-dependent rRNA methyltransferase [Clostridiales bacterium]|nr:class I SAM-dependent rRNA methyltransferase [Clostridiales bacterium]
MPYTIYLKKNEEKRLIAGHSWVFANEVAKIDGKDKNGSLATVCSFDGRFIGKGYINHASKILVRIFIRNDETDEGDFYFRRIQEAWVQRQKLGYENCCRVVFGEADNLPALIVDKYADILVIQCLSLGIHQRKKQIVDALVQIFQPKGIFERSDVAVRAKEGLPLEKGVLYGEVPDEVIIEENGLKMSVDVKNGQKTGYFLDQKENRFSLRLYAKGGRVLDCFCNSGGFSLNASLTACEVTAVDVSEFALANVRKNAQLNGITNIKTEQADVFELLREKRKSGEKYDLVVLDPPAFCKSAGEVKDAYRGYKDINVLGIKLVEKGGYLATCSCSHYMTLPLFERMLSEAAKESGRRVRVLEMRTQAPDHPALLNEEETQYLKFFVLQVL